MGHRLKGLHLTKYLGIWLDDKLTYSSHIDSLLKKLRPTLGFYFRLKKCFSFVARRRLVESTLLWVLDYGDIIYMHAPQNVLKKLDVVYHTALWFVTGISVRTHHCNLYEMTNWTSLCLRRKKHMLIFILKALVVKLPQYISSLLTYCTNIYNTRLTDKLLLKMPIFHTEIGRSAFSNYAPYVWNELQGILHMESVPSLAMFKNILKSVYIEQCTCFNNWLGFALFFRKLCFTFVHCVVMSISL